MLNGQVWRCSFVMSSGCSPSVRIMARVGGTNGCTGISSGARNRRVMMANAATERFSFTADPAALNEVELRLKRTVWPEEVTAEPWHYGPPVAYMKGFIQHWLEQYDWRTHEARLNSF